MMKRVLIYTYKHSNYGAVLQAYALQTFLRNNFPVDVEIVDFTTGEHLKSDSLLKSTGGVAERILVSLCNLIHFREITRRNTRIESFKNSFLKQTRRFSTIEELIANPPPADIYITGSDQVFNPQSRYVPVYYLNFDKGKGIKVAYAPSFGISEFSPEITERIRPLLNDFDFLSCRETLGANYLSSIVKRPVPTVCDPTLLLSQEEWATVARKPRIREQYILVYEINGGDKIIQLAKRLSAQKKLPIICLTRKSYKHYKVRKIVRDAGPSEFVGWFHNAAYVVTDSFHGTVFSWIFGKEFFYYLAYEATSTRVKNLLHYLSCEDRIVRKDEINSFQASRIKPYSKIGFPLIEASKKFIESFINYE